ncbi:hypothetical protein [Dyadobacter bucti]|uniref:hypothetical protein n=1 Tax=Dyadobacter bucti TaxID=2572203 RepID=UPI00110850E0|nr:hypothetical protein [Dyadobacter bucti]
MAKEQINEFGRTVILRRNNEGQYDPSDDSFTGSTSAEESIKALFTDFTEKEIDGTIILRGDKKVLIASAELLAPPQHNDTIVDGNDEYKIIPMSTIQPGDTPIIYKLQVRK